MLEVNLIFEVHCQRPQWGIINPISKFNDSRYRVYVNDDLITERSWVWDSNIFLCENMWIYRENNKKYTVKLEPVVCIPEQAKFRINNLKISNSNADINMIDEQQVNFTLQ
jgi:hypothetical protein